MATTGSPTSSSQGLTFAKGKSRYHYVWSTQPAWAGTCRQFIVKLVDGTYHRANFRLLIGELLGRTQWDRCGSPNPDAGVSV